MIYIGRHSTDKLEDGYLGSGKLLKRDIKELGNEHFKRDILFIFDNRDDMIAKEIELVNDEFRNREDTYNMALGSDSWGMLGIKLDPRTDEYRKKMSIVKKGKKLKPLTDEHKSAISKALTGKPSSLKGKKFHSEEQKEKWKIERTGKKHTPETIQKLTELNLGENNPNFGKKASDETRELMSLAHKGKKKPPRTPEHTEKLRLCNLGRKRGPHSEEHRKNLSLAHIGKEKKPETREKIRQTLLKKGRQKKLNILTSIIFGLINNMTDKCQE